MQLGDLTADEVDVIRRRRDEQARRVAAVDFQRKAIAMAGAFTEWSKQTGNGLTFSTFIDSFGYQDNDGSAMYAAVQRIFEAALPR